MNAPMTILEAVSDPNIFGRAFLAPTWDRWRVFLAALWALPMDDDALAIYRHHTGRLAAPSAPSRYAELVCGRRGGKSRILAAIAVYLACLYDHTDYIVPGETPVVAIIAADRRQAKVIFDYVLGFLRESPFLAEFIGDVLSESVRLKNRVAVEVHTASIGAPRGRTFLAVLADETAFWTQDGSANPDIEVINAVRPGLSTIPYSLLLVASSPYARRGLLYENYSRYFGRDDAPVLVWQGSTQEMNSSLVDDALIKQMEDEDPERASAEFGAQFRTDIVAFITRQAVEDCLARGVREIPPGGGITYVGHVDPSGGSADSMTLAIAHVNAAGLAVLDCVRERKPPFSPADVAAEYSAVLKSYGIATVIGDAYAGEWPREQFANHGISYVVSKRNTSTIYLEFLPALNAGRVQLLDLPRLIGQLVGLERRTARGGRDSISHAPGAHDDVANAVCGALVQVIADRRPALVKSGDLLVNGEGVGTLKRCTGILATIATADDGMAAVVFCAMAHEAGRMVVLDFDVCPASPRMFQAISERLDDLVRQHNARWGVVGLWAPDDVVRLALPAGIQVNEVPPEFMDPAAMMLSAAWHIGGGAVKVSALVIEKAANSPWGAAFDFRGGADLGDDPLRVAALIAIRVALDDRPVKVAA